jgi:rod shape-determining protein MreC
MRTVVASKKPVWTTVAVVLLFHVLLLSVQHNRRFNTAFVRVWLLDSIAPLEKLVDVGLNGVGRVWHGYFALVGMYGENLKLRAENDTLKMQLAQKSEEVLEAGRLRKLVDLQNGRLGKTVVARVIGRDPDPFQLHQTVTIDKGQAHGIQIDSSVMTADGVVGRVIYVANLFSIVQLVVDSQSAVAVMVGSGRRQAIVKGTAGKELEIDYIDDDNDVKQGDPLITSGMDRVHPKGLPFGVVSSVGARKGLFKTIKIRPTADLGRLEEVLCIVEHPPEVPEPSALSPAAANTN